MHIHVLEPTFHAQSCIARTNAMASIGASLGAMAGAKTDAQFVTEVLVLAEAAFIATIVSHRHPIEFSVRCLSISLTLSPFLAHRIVQTPCYPMGMASILLRKGPQYHCWWSIRGETKSAKSTAEERPGLANHPLNVMGRGDVTGAISLDSN